MSGEGLRCQFSFWWRPRGGGRRELTFTVPDFSNDSYTFARERAVQCGYPGHNGGWWNYLVDDVHMWFVRRGWQRCKCHPRLTPSTQAEGHNNG